MSDHPPSLDAMLAAWNESDPTKIRGHLDSALTADVHFVDPHEDIVGIDAFEEMVHKVQARAPGAVYSRISAVDSHHALYRYHWAVDVGGQRVLEGFDVTEVSADKVCRVLGFFGPLPMTGSG